MAIVVIVFLKVRPINNAHISVHVHGFERDSHSSAMILSFTWKQEDYKFQA